MNFYKMFICSIVHNIEMGMHLMQNRFLSFKSSASSSEIKKIPKSVQAMLFEKRTFSFGFENNMIRNPAAPAFISNITAFLIPAASESMQLRGARITILRRRLE